VITLLFAMIYKVLPDVKLAWRDVWVGALVTAGLFTIGKFLIGLYLGTSSLASTYGAAGSVLVVLVWVYYSSQLILLGAEFTRAYVEQFGPRPPPVDFATKDPKPRIG
jgi:membrane protein